METKMPSGHTDIKAFLNEIAKSAQIYTGLKDVNNWDREILKNHYVWNDGDPSTKDSYHWLYEKYFNDAKRVLDVGCGNGLFVFGLKLNTDINVVGIDGSSTMIDLCNEIKIFLNIDKVDFTECLAEDITVFGDNTFDVAFSQHFLEHATCPEKVLKEMKRVAKNVCGFLPYDHHADTPKEHLWHWNENTLRELMKKVFDETLIEVRKFGNLLAYGARGINE